jgi:hypothetical protein
MLKQTVKGLVLASAVGALFASGQARAETKTLPKPKELTKEVHCAGVNSCSGKGSCASASNGCAGQNSCKGKGWVPASAQECKAKGGKVLADADAKGK